MREQPKREEHVANVVFCRHENWGTLVALLADGHRAGRPSGNARLDVARRLFRRLYGATGVLITLLNVRAGGPGQVVDIGLYEAVFRVLDELAPAYARAGIVREREGAGTRNACPHGHFPTRDGKWIAIACTTDKMFAKLARAMGRPDLSTTYGLQERRLAARDTMDRLVAAWSGRITQAEAMACRLAEDVPAGPLNSIEDIFDDPQFEARENLMTLEVPEIGPVVVPNVVPKLAATPGRIVSLGPPLGNANDEIYRGLLGLSTAEIKRLRTAGVI
jgi:succinyl-CoA:(S)-malate CoA-transferase subunit A